MGTAENPDFSYGVCKRSLSYDNYRPSHALLQSNQNFKKNPFKTVTFSILSAFYYWRL